MIKLRYLIPYVFALLMFYAWVGMVAVPFLVNLLGF